MSFIYRDMSALLLVSIAATVLPSASPAADTGIDSAFVGKVSQGGSYEVEASKIAASRAVAQDVKDLAESEVRDHERVNASLKKLATAAGISIAGELNGEFQQRLATLKAVSPHAFDAAYIEDMKQIHDKDEKLFAQEAIDGTAPFKAFAHQTDLIVKRHIGALHGTD